MMGLALDDRGNPVLLWDGKTTVVVSTDTTVKLENPALIEDSLELARRRDAVRDAAREFEELSEQDLRERLRHATTRPLTPAEIARFRDDVRAQVLDDLVDAMDQGRRGRLRSRRTVRVVAPRGYLAKARRGLSPEERDEVESRLRARGWTDQDVNNVLGAKITGPPPMTPSPGVVQS